MPGLGAGGPVVQVISRQNPWEPPGHLPLCLLISAFQNQITSLLHLFLCVCVCVCLYFLFFCFFFLILKSLILTSVPKHEPLMPWWI